MARRHSKLPKRIRSSISRRIKLEFDRGHPIKQSVAIAFSKARKKYPKYRGQLAKK